MTASLGSCVSDCPRLLVGFSGFLAAEGWHGMLQAHCAEWEIVGGGPYVVDVVSINLGPIRGEVWDVDQGWTRICPIGEGVVAIQSTGGAFIDSMTISCAPLLVSGSGGGLTLSVGPASDVAPIGGSGGTPFNPIECSPGNLAVGLNLRSGFYIDMLQLVCDGFREPTH